MERESMVRRIAMGVILGQGSVVKKVCRGMRCGTSYWLGEVLGKKQGKHGTGKGVGRKVLLEPEKIVKKKTLRRKQGKKKINKKSAGSQSAVPHNAANFQNPVTAHPEFLIPLT